MQKALDRPDMASVIDEFVRQVKHNCNISDAKFWGLYSICGLLMRYRELYRNEQVMKPWDIIINEEIIRWIHERETLWNNLEDLELLDLVIDGSTYDPFDIKGVNAELNHTGLVYGSGYGAFNKPTFFVGHIDEIKDLFDYRVHYIGQELCRDIAAAPAMLQGRCIYLRAEVIAQFLWDRYLDMKSSDFCLPTAAMFSHYRIDRTTLACPELHEQFRHLVDDAAEVFVMHEVGEAYEDEYDDAWHEILFAGCDKATELFLRGIKDIRADTATYGPLKWIIDRQSHPQLSIFVAFMDGIRREIFPEIRSAVAHVKEQNAWVVIESARVTGYQRAALLQHKVVRLWQQLHDVAAVAQLVRDAFPRHG